MAQDPKALTMAGWALRNTNPKAQAIVFSLVNRGNIMARDVPLETRKAMSLAGLRWDGDLPAVTWAAANELPTVVTGDPSRHEEQAYLIRNKIITDMDFIGTEGQISNPHTDRIKAYLRSTSYTFNDAFINNDPANGGDAKAIVGLRARLGNTALYKTISDCTIAGPFTLTSAATAAQLNAFFEALDQLLQVIESPEGEGVVIYCNDDLIRRISGLARTYAGQGGFSQAEDQLGRSVMTYKKAQIRDVGPKADQSTKIIKSTETSAGVDDGSSTYTSLFGVHYGEEGMGGWQFDSVFGEKTYEDNDGISLTTVLKWGGGLFPRTNRCFGRIKGIKLS